MEGEKMHSFTVKKEQEKTFCSYLKMPHSLIYKVGATTGLRVSDIISLRKSILKTKEPTIKEQKTGKSKRIYIPQKLRREMIQYSENNQSEYIFSGNGKSGHITRQSVHKAFKKAANKADIDVNIATHAMRKKYARTLYAKGKTLKYIQGKLNHKSISDTLLYLTDER